MKELSWFLWQQELGLYIVLCSVTECTDPHMALPPPVTRQYLFSDHSSLSSFYPLSQLFPFSTLALGYFFLFAFSIPFFLTLSFSPSIIDSPPPPPSLPAQWLFSLGTSFYNSSLLLISCPLPLLLFVIIFLFSLFPSSCSSEKEIQVKKSVSTLILVVCWGYMRLKVPYIA